MAHHARVQQKAAFCCARVEYAVTLPAHPNVCPNPPSLQLYFTADYLLRLFTHPQYKDFLKMFLPWLDILSILPFYVEVIMMIASKLFENYFNNILD